MEWFYVLYGLVMIGAMMGDRRRGFWGDILVGLFWPLVAGICIRAAIDKIDRPAPSKAEGNER